VLTQSTRFFYECQKYPLTSCIESAIISHGGEGAPGGRGGFKSTISLDNVDQLWYTTAT